VFGLLIAKTNLEIAIQAKEHTGMKQVIGVFACQNDDLAAPAARDWFSNSAQCSPRQMFVNP
jgi:hypothetical protein